MALAVSVLPMGTRRSRNGRIRTPSSLCSSSKGTGFPLEQPGTLAGLSSDPAHQAGSPLEDSTNFLLALLKFQLAVVGYYFDAVAGFEVAGEEFGGERVEEEILDGSFEGPGAELRVVA